MQRPARPDPIDPAPFRRLLDLVGPAQAGAFRAQLISDLDTCEAQIARGRDGSDWALLRQASHDLIALAGAAGATDLQDLARRLNGAAHDEAAADLALLGDQIASQLVALTAYVRTAEGPDDAS
jgi:hypothetical protein